MNFSHKPRKNGTVIILGAGASYGAAIRDTPPIMRDFIRIGKNLVTEDYSDLWKFLDSIGYPESQLNQGIPNLEELYSVLQVLSKGIWHTNDEEFIAEIGKPFWKVPPVSFLESFIMEVTNISSIRALKKPCKYHDSIVSKLSKGDTIISFNYDLIVDASVTKSKHFWSELDGYGFPCIELLNWHENKYDSNLSSDLALLKPHGSLNWKLYSRNLFQQTINNTKQEPSIQISIPSFHERLNRFKSGNKAKIEVRPLDEIKKQAYEGPLGISTAHFYDELMTRVPMEEQWKFHGVETPETNTFIIPPSLSKFGELNIPEPLSQIWSTIRDALTLARTVLIIGYSFPATDLEFNTLFRLSMKNNQAKKAKILLVNPDQAIKEKISQMVPGIKVEHIADTLKEYAG
jgi:hypothetical protein